MTTETELRPLTKRTRQVLDAIGRFQKQNGYCTTVRELMNHFGWTSPNAVMFHLRILRNSGFVQWEPRVGRTIRPTGEKP